MKKEPKTIKEVNENLIELKQELIGIRERLNEMHKKFHLENIKTPLPEIKELENKKLQYEELIEIQLIRKENFKFDNIEIKLRHTIEEMKKEINNLKIKLNKNK